MSVGIYYNSDIRNNGTAVLCMDGLKNGLSLGDSLRRYRSPVEDGFELPKHTLNLMIDDGRDDISYVPPSPNAFYAIDTHLGWEVRLNKARKFDVTYCAQKPAVEKMIAEGVNAKWLPLACSPMAHPNLSEVLDLPREKLIQLIGPNGNMDVKNEIAFVGFLRDEQEEGYNSRIDYLDKLFGEIPNCWLSYNVFFEAMAVPFIRSKLGFNISIRDDLNMRFFEVLSTGTCLLTNRNVAGLEELGFVEGEHYIGYEGMEEMVERAQWGLAHPMEREEIAARGHALVREKHTYADRMRQILEDFNLIELIPS